MITWQFLTSTTGLPDYTNFTSSSSFSTNINGAATEGLTVSRVTSQSGISHSGSSETFSFVIFNDTETDSRIIFNATSLATVSSHGITVFGLSTSSSSSGRFVSSFFTNGTAISNSGSTVSVASNSGSGFLGTVANNTTMTSSSTQSFKTSTTASFPSSYLTGSFTSASFVPSTATSSYADIATTSATSNITITILTTTTIQSSYGAGFYGLGVVASPGEVIWFATGSISDTPVSALQSTTGSTSFFLFQPFITFAPSSSSVITIIANTSASFSQFVSTFTIQSTVISISNFAIGGFSTFTAITGRDVTSSTTVSVGLQSTTTATSTFGTTTFSVIDNSFILSTLFTELIISNGLFDALYSTLTVNAFVASTMSVSSEIFINPGASFHSSTFSSSSSTTAFNNQFGQTGNTSFNTFALTTYTTTGMPYGITTIIGNPIAFTRHPNFGFRITPDGNLISQIGIGNTSNFSMAKDNGSYVFEVGIETVPVQYPGIKSWIDSESVTYTASWSSISISVTGRTSSYSIIGTSTITYNFTSSSALTWTGAGNVTETIFNELTGSHLFLGSGTYGTDLTSPATVFLLPGCYAFSTYTTIVTNSETFTISTADFVRTLAMAENDNFGDQPFVVEQRSNYNQ